MCSGTVHNPSGAKYNPEPLIWSDDPDCATATSCDEFSRPYDFGYDPVDCATDGYCTCFWVEDQIVQVSDMPPPNLDLLYDYPKYDTLMAYSDNEGGFYIPWFTNWGPPNSYYVQYMDDMGNKLWGDNGKAYSGHMTYSDTPKLLDVEKGFLTIWLESLPEDEYSYTVNLELIDKDGDYNGLSIMMFLLRTMVLKCRWSRGCSANNRL